MRMRLAGWAQGRGARIRVCGDWRVEAGGECESGEWEWDVPAAAAGIMDEGGAGGLEERLDWVRWGGGWGVKLFAFRYALEHSTLNIRHSTIPNDIHL
jgi:hypothetical protein